MSEQLFDLVANYEPAGDQVPTISKVTNWIENGVRDMTIHGITGSGKTFTMANIIKNANRPAIIYSPNKILAFQLYEEFKTFFPNNEVHYYVSNFDLYRPEFVKYGEFHEKQSVSNPELEQLTLDATTALASGKRDVIIISSASCIFGTGSPEMYKKSTIDLSLKTPVKKAELLFMLYHAGYSNQGATEKLSRGLIQVGKTVIRACTYSLEHKEIIWELKFDPEDNLSRIIRITRTTNEDGEQKQTKESLKTAHIFPATRYTQDVYTEEELDIISENIMHEAKRQRQFLHPDRYELLIRRIEDDMMSIRSHGYCNGIENYAWYFNRSNLHRRFDPSDYFNMTPFTLMSYLPEDTLFFIDESHLSLGQIDGFVAADFSRKDDLVKAGIRLPSCIINRPMRYQEVRDKNLQTIYVSATPRQQELENSGDHVAQLWIRPTYLLDPEIKLVYLEDLEAEGTDLRTHVIRQITEAKSRGGAVLLRCPDKRICYHFLDHLRRYGFSAEVMLAETPTPMRRELMERLQASNEELEPLDVIIGVNLIREGLDIPRVEKVLITYADKGGFLNDTTSLIQVIGRAARNQHGEVTMYLQSEKFITSQIADAIEQTHHRRKLQMEYNEYHGKTPRTAVANSYLNNLITELDIDDSDQILPELEDIDNQTELNKVTKLLQTTEVLPEELAEIAHLDADEQAMQKLLAELELEAEDFAELEDFEEFELDDEEEDQEDQED